MTIQQASDPTTACTIDRRRLVMSEAERTFDRASRTFASATDSYRCFRSGMPARDVPPIPSVALARRFREQLHLTRQVTNGIGEGVLAVDLEARISFANPAAAQLLGCAEHQLVGRRVYEAVDFRRSDGAPVPLDSHPVLDALRTGEVLLPPDGVWDRDDGATLAVSYRCSPITANGDLLGVTVTFRGLAAASGGEGAPLVEQAATRSPGIVDPSLAALLTRREREVLDLLVRGVTSDRELAEQLVVSHNTVKYHLGNILGNLGLQNRTQIVAHALGHGSAALV